MVGFGEESGDSGSLTREALAARLAQVQEQFRATSDILKVLTSSSSEQDRVFDAVVDNASRLLDAAGAQIYLVRGDSYVLARETGMSPELRELVKQRPIRRDRGTLVGRVTIDRTIQHIPDVLADPEYGRSDLLRVGGYRSMVGAPMMVGDHVMGALSVWRNEVDPFDATAEQLLETFAEQAALALRHVELFSAVESRSAELARKVDQLEALAEVGAAISSTLVPDQVLSTIVEHDVELSGTDGGSIFEYDDAAGMFRVRTTYGTSDDLIAALRAAEMHIERTWMGRAARTRQVLQIPGGLEILSTHDQILGGPSGQVYLGARFPADPAYATTITRSAEAVGRVLARKCVLGRFALDFVVVRHGDEWEAHAIEVNLRKGGTTHPFLTLQFLTDGVYEHEQGRFITPSGAERHLVATDHLEDDALRGMRVADLFDLVARAGLHFDQARQEGLVFHMISSITECGRVGMTAIADRPESAQAVFDRAESALLTEARESLTPLPLPR
jgi:GAF domain-containing protein